MAAIIDFGQLSPAFILEAFTYALIGGVLPALLWLWFWMHESHQHHEPKQTIWLTFLFGMCGVFLVYPFEQWAQSAIGGADSNFYVLMAWAFCEELVKFGAAYFIAFRDKQNVFDEPIDAFVYLMTAALGFAAMENTLLILAPLLQGDTLTTVVTGNLRFMGASLLHVASSGVLSIFISYAYFRPKLEQKAFLVFGLIAAILLHTFFNFLIIGVTEAGKGGIFVAFSFVWLTVVFLILALERIKTIKEF